mmetsp:Transcript_28945/g.53225  ORF Transcript_28945/g.53225 Transcript_28945/m.53225 type:complete len:185 (+) Transcript_28945:183-737(+)
MLVLMELQLTRSCELQTSPVMLAVLSAFDLKLVKRLCPVVAASKSCKNGNGLDEDALQWKERSVHCKQSWVLDLQSARAITTVVIDGALEECSVARVAGEALANAGFVEAFQRAVALRIVTGPDVHAELLFCAVAICHQDVNCWRENLLCQAIPCHPIIARSCKVTSLQMRAWVGCGWHQQCKH